jgi:hypothetical protein
MMPLLTNELLTTAIELVCYFCTAIGLALTILFTRRS